MSGKFSPFFKNLVATNGDELMSVATYRCVPEILEFMGDGQEHSASNVYVATGLDPSLTVKILKWMTTNKLIASRGMKPARSPVYQITDRGMVCKQAFDMIKAEGDKAYA